MVNEIPVLIADDHPIFRKGLYEVIATAVVLLTMHRNERLFNTALDVVEGYVLKDSAMAAIVSAIRRPPPAVVTSRRS